MKPFDRSCRPYGFLPLCHYTCTFYSSVVYHFRDRLIWRWKYGYLEIKVSLTSTQPHRKGYYRVRRCVTVVQGHYDSRNQRIRFKTCELNDDVMVYNLSAFTAWLHIPGIKLQTNIILPWSVPSAICHVWPTQLSSHEVWLREEKKRSFAVNGQLSGTSTSRWTFSKPSWGHFCLTDYLAHLVYFILILRSTKLPLVIIIIIIIRSSKLVPIESQFRVVVLGATHLGK